MLDGKTDTINYEMHVLTTTQQQSGNVIDPVKFENIFQFDPLKYEFINQRSDSSLYTGQSKVDRLNFKANFNSFDFRIGRQAISWGVGRFWQPTDVFGAFDAAELVRDYKPGIDVFNFNFYPDSFSNVNFIYVLSSSNNSNFGIKYSRPVGESSYLSLITANIEKNIAFGGSLESDWRGTGFHFEAVFLPDSTSTNTGTNDTSTIYSIAGFDYQFSSEWLLTSEIYFNNRGANRATDFNQILSAEYFQNGLLKQLSQQLFALSLQKNITPLIDFNYLWISAILSHNKVSISSLHQLSAVYSISNESDIRVTLLSTNGKNLDNNQVPQSEFGHIPSSLSFSLRLYF